MFSSPFTLKMKLCPPFLSNLSLMSRFCTRIKPPLSGLHILKIAFSKHMVFTAANCLMWFEMMLLLPQKLTIHWHLVLHTGSILDKLIAHLTYTDPLYKLDNATVYSLLEEATCGSVYASTIKPYAQKKDGHSVWMSMVSSHAGKDKWEQLQKDRTKFIMNSKWNGRTFSLEKFTSLHHTSSFNSRKLHYMSTSSYLQSILMLVIF